MRTGDGDHLAGPAELGQTAPSPIAVPGEHSDVGRLRGVLLRYGTTRLPGVGALPYGTLAVNVLFTFPLPC